MSTLQPYRLSRRTGIGLAATVVALAAGQRSSVGRIAKAQTPETSPDLPSGPLGDQIRWLLEVLNGTVYTEAYSTNWPDAPHRVLRSCIDAANSVKDGEIVGYLDWYGTPDPIHRFDCMTIDRSTTGNIAAMPHWAGQGVGSVRHVQSAAEIVQELAREAERLLAEWSPQPAG